MAKEDIPVVVFSGSILQAEMLKSVLEDEGIKAYLQDETMGTLAPFIAAPGGLGAVKVLVAGRDADRAREIVAEVRQHQAENEDAAKGEDPG